jgi:hypothetical protein
MFNHRLQRKFQIANPKHENAVGNFATRGQLAACWIWILELGVLLGFEDWNLGFPDEPSLRITTRGCVRELQ